MLLLCDVNSRDAPDITAHSDSPFMDFAVIYEKDELCVTR